MLQYLFATKQNKVASFFILFHFFFFISVKGIAAPNVLFVSGKRQPSHLKYFRLENR